MSAAGNRSRGTTEYIRVLAELVRAAESRGVTTYPHLAVIMGLPPHGSTAGKDIDQVLGEIAEAEVNAGRPLLSAVAVSAAGEVGPGFFALARNLGLFGGAPGDQESFWRRELRAVYETWKRPSPGPSSGT